MSLYKDALKVSPRYRKPNSPPVRLLGHGCLSGPTEAFVGPKYTDAHPIGTRQMSDADILKGMEDAAFIEARRWERNNPIELQGVKFTHKLSTQDREYREQATHRDRMWSLISHTRKLQTV